MGRAVGEEGKGYEQVLLLSKGREKDEERGSVSVRTSKGEGRRKGWKGNPLRSSNVLDGIVGRLDLSGLGPGVSLVAVC